MDVGRKPAGKLIILYSVVADLLSVYFLTAPCTIKARLGRDPGKEQSPARIYPTGSLKLDRYQPDCPGLVVSMKPLL